MYDFMTTDAGIRVIDAYAAWYVAYGFICIALGIMTLSGLPFLWRKKVDGGGIFIVALIGATLCIVGFPALASPRAEAIHYIVKEMKQQQPEPTT